MGVVTNNCTEAQQYRLGLVLQLLGFGLELRLGFVSVFGFI